MTTIVKELRDALVDAGARPELADEAAAAVVDSAARSELATKGDIAELKAELYRRPRCSSRPGSRSAQSSPCSSCCRDGSLAARAPGLRA